MHELLLFAQIPPSQHAQLLSILAGIAAMQPQPFVERHLVFKPVRAPGSPRTGSDALPNIPGMMADGALQAFQHQTRGDTFYVQLVAGLKVGRRGKGNGDGDGVTGEGINPKPESKSSSNSNSTSSTSSNDFESVLAYAHAHLHEQPSPQNWTLQFRDLPEVPGRRPVVSRLIADYPVQTTDPVAFMAALGYAPTTSFHISGHRLTHLSTLFTLSRCIISSSPPPPPSSSPQDSPQDNPVSENVGVDNDTSLSDLAPPRISANVATNSKGETDADSHSPPQLRLLDPSLTTLLTLTLLIQDGTKPELLTRGISELVGIKELLKGVVELGLQGGERLSLDSRVR